MHTYTHVHINIDMYLLKHLKQYIKKDSMQIIQNQIKKC